MDLHNNAAQIGEMAASLGQQDGDTLSNDVYVAWQNDWLMTSPP